MSGPRPTLDMIVADPLAAAELPRETVTELLGLVAAAQSVLVARLLAASEPANGARAVAAEPDDDWITPDEAAALLRRSPRWVWRNKKNLPWVRRPGNRGRILCSRSGLMKWLEKQKP